MEKISNTEANRINSACARFCSWKYFDSDRTWRKGEHGPINMAPDYLHSSVAADELMTAVRDCETITPMVLTQSVEGICRVSLFQGTSTKIIWHDAPDWKEALARAVAALQLVREAKP